MSKLKDFLLKDTSGKNESKKMIIVIRMIILALLLYFFMNGIILIGLLNNQGIYIFLISQIIFVLLFIFTYHFKTITVLWTFNISMLIWTVLSIKFFGWNIGVQHFLMVLLILYFFSSYQQYVGKVIYACVLCAIRIYLYYMCQNTSPVVRILPEMEDVLQLINTITIFFCISLIAFVFSKDCQELEGKLIEYNKRLKEEASTDTLTKLFNRRKAMEYLDSITEKGWIDKGFSLCICDVDFFKKVNDNYGHDTGDRVLKSISDIIKKELKEENFAARWGGEEFLLIFPQCNGDEAFEKLEALRKKIKSLKIEKDGISFGITLTYGLAEYDFSNGLEATIEEADRKLYMGKEKGRDVIIF